ncbi:trimethylamine---corrinoid protein Co-methyltransferase [Dethiosulfatibacter aminovorans DSM 17477]|uniref:Methyltransferase n=1 Tax=Dethiosulfatibacter aminovorans DSM 17477 TaxID=1121476 RepID=A0A1M6IQ89_9FIRM|nr:trimethylamine methyltransferase family protein [Dethiosulfatibacter aminovorans]SHJ36558.1 trimethylamine---corrinoid protein Co-methyltransferase [Dethiosulfatibacter aminovorans DSM 17477]
MFKAAEGGQLRLLSDTDIKKIHETSMKILEDTGMKIKNADARKIFAENGAEVDEETHIVKIPREMVMKAVESAPSKVILYGKEEKNDLHLEKTRTHLGTGGTVLYALDLETGKKRPTETKDVRDIARMVDYCNNTSFYVINTYPQDVPDSASDVNRFYWGLTNTNKHVMGGMYTMEGLKGAIDIAEQVAGGADELRKRPIASFIVLMISPLIMDDLYSDFLIEIAKKGLPVVVSSEPLAGATSPVTIAGTIAINNAETLAGITLTQLVNPGTPILYGSTSSIMDMREGTYMAGAVESAMINAGISQMTQFYDLPMYGTAGMSDSKTIDTQAGYESAITAMTVALSGSNYIHDSVGLLEMCQVFSYDKMVIDNEILGNVLRVMDGITVNDDTLALDVIQRVGPGGHYLSDDHTVAHVRNEFFMPKIADRQTRIRWEEGGSKTTEERARKVVDRILKKHVPKPVHPELKAKIRSQYPGIMGDELY